MESLVNKIIGADNVKKDNKTVLSADLDAVRQETGFDRIRRMFRTTEFNEITPEANIILQSGCMGLFVGAVYGGVTTSRVAYINFIQNNQATAFNDHLHAKKMLQDAVTKSFSRGAWKWGWRLGLFTTSYVGISTLISVYRNESGIREHVISGALTGALYKFFDGPRAWVVGGALGMVLGTFAGCCTYGILSLTGMSMEEVRFWNYKWKESRQEQMRETIHKRMEQEQLMIVKEYKEKHKAIPITIDNIPDSSRPS